LLPTIVALPLALANTRISKAKHDGVCFREEAVRVISLRKSNSREVKSYAET